MPLPTIAAVVAAASGVNSLMNSSNANRNAKERDRIRRKTTEQMDQLLQRARSENWTKENWDAAINQLVTTGNKVASKVSTASVMVDVARQYQGAYSPAAPAGNVPDLDALNAQILGVTDPKGINALYNTAAGNLNQQAAQVGGQARQQTASLAASRGLLNPNAAIASAGNQAAAPIYGQMGQLESSRAGTLNQNLLTRYNLMYGLNRARQSDTNAAQQLQLQLEQMRNYQRQLEEQRRQFDVQTSPDWMDYLGLGTKILSIPGVPSYLSNFFKSSPKPIDYNADPSVWGG